jgi:hypothetical protein
VSDDSVSLDLDQLTDVLHTEWDRIRSADEDCYLEDDSLRRQIRELLTDDRYGVQTFRYMLLSSVLTKAVHPEVHYRAVQTESTLDGAFSSRTVAEQVIVDWEQANGQRLGGSNEPGTSKPFRWAEISRDNSVMRDDVLDSLHGLLAELEARTEAAEIDPKDVLRQALVVISRLDSQTVEFTDPSRVPFRDLEPAVEEYLRQTGGGERLAAVAAGVVETVHGRAGSDEWSVTADQVNIPDEQSSAAGDIELFREGDLQYAYEVKDKPVAENDIHHSVEKAQANELGEYLYLVGDGFETGEQQGAKQAAAEAPIELLLVTPDEMLSRLKFVGEQGRIDFLTHAGDFLDDMRAQPENRRDWKQLVEGLDGE